MLDYLNQTLGLSAEVTPWAEAERLPLYLRIGKKYSLLQIESEKCILIEADEKDFNLPAFRKQMAKLPHQTMPIVLCFRHLDSRHRKSLIEARIPFIVPGSQIYLPFLGIVLQERMRAAISAPQKLSPAAQMILLYLIYEPVGSFESKVELARKLDVSQMNVTRAVQELTALELVTVKKAGRCDLVYAAEAGKALYEKARPYLIDPVQKRLYVRERGSFSELPMAGEYALSTHSVLSSPTVECRAISRKAYKGLEGVEGVDPTWSSRRDYIQLEVWKYDPKPLSRYGGVDVISLALSLRENADERVEQAVEEMMEGYLW